MKIRTWLLMIGIGALFLFSFSIGVTSYFHSKELDEFSQRCVEEGGTPEVSKSFLSLSYSFTCEDLH